ncbi:MAG: bifunctional methylenetetrahydrofolate dehydrogenase/methenyltetrahydrofolate cyclohydrolase FolD [Christensenella sp.]|nr:bifunctional methylenetetrahydrofolate dehydrogenase/methenyltetrahydrofolate cyclohydrolase FolD [Christensenella sp.]
MSAQIISGKELSAEIRQQLKERVKQLKETRGIVPGLAVIQVGDDGGSTIYVNNKEKACAEVGIYSEVNRLPEHTTQKELLQLVERYNKDPKIHGLLVQLPLPAHIDEDEILKNINPQKDVDGFHVQNAGSLFTGLPGLVACTPKGIIQLIKKSGIDLTGKTAVVIGRSNIVGKPVAMLLLNENATVTICHSRTKNLPQVCAQADVLVAAIGKPEFVTKDFVKPGAVVIDVGTSRVDGKLKGDVKFDEVSEVAGYITPVPGGVGPMTITMLMENTVDAGELYG